MYDVLRSSHVSIATGFDGYPSEPPYSPGVSYPEYPFGTDSLTKEVNQAYEGVRDALRLLGVDAERYGQKDWNPLGKIIRPGNTVVLKPNFIRDFRETQPGHEDCLITHGSIIRAAVDFVYIALKGEGHIVIADASQNDADFDMIRRMAGLDEIQAFYRRHAGFEVEIYDLRPEKARKVDGVIVGHERLPGDPAGYVKVNLGRYSEFCELSHLCHLLYASEYDTSEVRLHHHSDTHEYLVCKTVLDADCVVNLAKLKTHKKTGVTLCMKNLVGINGNKNWLPHHREGTPSEGGDQFSDDSVRHRIERRTMACFRRIFPLLGPIRGGLARSLKSLGKRIFGDTNTDTIRSGNWYGNDTTWRMVLDLNRILIYADDSGMIQDSPTRRIFCIVDGIIGGEGNGPLDPVPRPAGMIVAGVNPVATDLTCARLIGFDHERLPLLYHPMDDNNTFPLTAFEYGNVLCRSNLSQFDRPLHEFDQSHRSFKPHFGWKGHIELNCPCVSETAAQGSPK